MCDIDNKTSKKTAVGYKAVIKIKGKYFSPSTGLEYKIGMKLPNMKVRKRNFDGDWANPLDDWYFYKPLMQGKTGVFRTITDCKNSFTHNQPYHILKMTLGGEIYNGSYSRKPIYIGSEIIDIIDIDKTTH